MACIEVSGLSKSFTTPRGARHILRDVSLSVAQGEFVSIVGAMGSGKSMLLSILAGLTSGDAGTVTVDGEPPAATFLSRYRPFKLCVLGVPCVRHLP